MGEVILSGEQPKKGEGEDACRGLIGAVFGAGIAHVTEDLDKMGKIVGHKNLRE